MVKRRTTIRWQDVSVCEQLLMCLVSVLANARDTFAVVAQVLADIYDWFVGRTTIQTRIVTSS
nr:ytzH-like protein [Cressdnaviricota sp.]UOF80218.1 ytzH-like protein [Cressdnaviricota sp.]